MRKNLQRYLTRLALVSIFFVGNAAAASWQRAAAHDLPPQTFSHAQLDSEHISDCLGTADCHTLPTTNITPERGPTAKPFAGMAIASPSSTLSIAIAASQIAKQAWGSQHFSKPLSEPLSAVVRFYTKADFLSANASASLPKLAARPDAGAPPRPTINETSVDQAEQLASRSLAKRNYVEDYRPYDLCIRDWRFGQYSYRGLSRVAHLDLSVAEINDKSQLALAIPSEQLPPYSTVRLGAVLKQLEHVQCVTTEALSSMSFVQRLAAGNVRLSQSLTKYVGDAAAKVATAIPAAPRQPLLTQPQYVIYEQHGKKFLLTTEQTRLRQLEQQDTSRIAAVTPVDATRRENSPRLMSDLRSKVLGAASRQLESLGTQFLQLSSLIDSLHQPQVASREQSDVR
ncbi:MAG: hypothetical protein R3C53_10990 [Pirellulaceae bacterium]